MSLFFQLSGDIGQATAGRNAEALHEIEQAREVRWSARRPLGAGHGAELDRLAASLGTSG